MNCYRISKYDPRYRDENGKYIVDDWTSFSDVNQEILGAILSIKEYETTEINYLTLLNKIFIQSGCKRLRIVEYENASNNSLPWYDGQMLNTNEEIALFAKDCLRELCWGKLVGKRLFIHFGYDYYMYVATQEHLEKIQSLTKENGLYCEKIMSPYFQAKDFFRYYF